MRPYFILFDRVIPFYGVLFFLGMFTAAGLAVLLCTKRKLERYHMVGAAVYAGIGGVAGAKLLFLLVTIRQIIELRPGFEALVKGGYVFYGGVIGGAIGLALYAKQFRLRAVDFFDVAAVVLPLGHAFGRVGCFFSGCCYGVPYDGALSYTYRYALGEDTPLGVSLLPIQLIEAVALFCLFLLLLFLYRSRPMQRGRELVAYLTGYPVLRFTLEFFRGDGVRGGILGLSTSQWISLVLLAVAGFFAKRLLPSRKD